MQIQRLQNEYAPDIIIFDNNDFRCESKEDPIF